MITAFRLVSSALLAGFSAAVVAQDITFFEFPDFGGRRFAASYAVPNMGETGFNDRASSVVIHNGSWQLCTDSHFRGRCVTLEPGQYRNLGQIGMSNQVSSARQVAGSWGGGGGNWGGGSSAGAVTLYEGPGFNGSTFGVDNDVSNLGRTNFNDRARSMVINHGTWELCRDSDYRGGCQVYGPGRYGNLGWLGGEVSSIRRAGGERPRVVVLTGHADNDLLRNEWFYRRSNLASLQFSYPELSAALAAWALAAVAMTALAALALSVLRRSASHPVTKEFRT